jgi:hypothetical protein
MISGLTLADEVNTSALLVLGQSRDLGRLADRDLALVDCLLKLWHALGDHYVGPRDAARTKLAPAKLDVLGDKGLTRGSRQNAGPAGRAYGANHRGHLPDRPGRGSL